MKKICILLFMTLLQLVSGQKNFIDVPYVETGASVDSLVVPDRIYLQITLKESDSKGKITVEENEQKMFTALKDMKIDIKKQLSLVDVSSNYKNYLLKNKDILKTKSYRLVVYDANTAAKAAAKLEESDISNVNLLYTEYSKQKELQAYLKGVAVMKSKENANNLLRPLNKKAGTPLHIVDTDSSRGQSYAMQADAAPYRSFAMKENSGYYDTNEAIDIQKITISASVSTIFAIEN